MKKTVFITGTATGIGKATALVFHKKGWNVAATMKSMKNISDFSTLKDINCYKLDVTDAKSIKESVDAALSDFGGIDVLVNNAGVYSTGPLESTPDEMIKRIFKVNVHGTINVTKTILPHFRKKRKGIIINVSSIAGKITFPYQSIYHGTKWALEGFSEGLSHELKAFNILVKTVEPGMVKTNLYDSVRHFPENLFPKDYRNGFKNWHTFLFNNFKKGYGPEISARTIFKAANDNRSKLRYTSGWDIRMAFLLKKFVPNCLFNTAIQKAAGI